MLQAHGLLSRLLFQCRYSGTSVEALVVEVNSVPPPPPVAAPGPLRVELRLANVSPKAVLKASTLSHVFLVY